MSKAELKLKEEMLPGAINSYVQYLSVSIAKDYSGNSIVLIPILKGAVPFESDLRRSLIRNDISTHVEYACASSYEKGERKDLSIDISNVKNIDKNDHVIILDTICDTGETLEAVHNAVFDKFNFKSLKCCVLFAKKETVKPIIMKQLSYGYVGKELSGNKFYVGYGLDYNGELREMPSLLSVINYIGFDKVAERITKREK